MPWLQRWILLGLLGIHLTTSEDVVNKCRNYARYIATYSHGRSQIPPDLEGEWTSSTCEAFAGPQFILRRILLTSNRRWHGRFHHYSDGWCVNPTFTISVKGRYRLKEESERTKGAYSSEFDFHHIVLTPHSVNNLISILSVAERFCPGAGLPILKREKNGQVLAPEMRNYSLGRDAYRKRECREILGLHFYSLRLVRVISNYKKSHLYDELYFGEVPTHRAKKTYIPSSLQYALVRSGSPSCRICRLIRSSSANFPPALSVQRRIGTIRGAWVSKNCEIQSDMFLSRFLRFYGDPFIGERKWELSYFYFSDANCDALSYIITASGNYSKDKPSHVIAGASNYAFSLSQLKITPVEQLIVTLLKSSPEGTCGEREKWTSGEEQDVTSTKGCAAFELYLPSTEHDILKVTRKTDLGLELYTGQRPTDDKSLNDAKNRPQSFQLPLSQCDDVAGNVRPITTGQPTEKPTIGIDIKGFAIPAELLPTRGTPNDVESRGSANRPFNGIGRRFKSVEWIALLSFCLLLTLSLT